MTHRNYLVQPQYYLPRAEDSFRQDFIKSKWKRLRPEANAHSNVANFLRFDEKARRFFFIDGFRDPRYDAHTLGSVISSAFLLYKLWCMEFYPKYPRGSAYKVLWMVSLRHQPTGTALVIEDYKAGVSIGMNFTQPDQLPTEFRNDLLELLDFLMSEEVVHPYDLTVAGSVA